MVDDSSELIIVCETHWRGKTSRSADLDDYVHKQSGVV
jgi:hypothetical protein